ncbi:hypothetical protein C8J56DRAFT_233348 [Mycena floridula]|nr:hypothetical protein C8J56DRAFT_233348 [Mycena floridula]
MLLPFLRAKFGTPHSYEKRYKKRISGCNRQLPDMTSPLASFNPFAEHPFTNNSGLMPAPPQPSQYPTAIRRYPVTNYGSQSAQPISYRKKDSTSSDSASALKKAVSKSPEAGSGLKK